ncbi:hypothetical protein C7B65_26390 [Phormidesmis priestleyi ULC007]|uniref:Uncharacterized protein n=1 Tax=Phormidesmis priestleyi ULC007 TaxID=1920490 RepID=A0A2T1D1V4_9CYAN|nr:hypothetical protein [Phormidesmis priestleyi]PSB14475.1 hypothetical protein C7B65_26390 [Phormidesmis priestleyi ULC007]PZO45508.1 MAG: hypothetical protein DCF14_24945 [Phormidesmis priestleyi]
MAERVTLTLPDSLAQQVHEVATLTQRPLEDVLLEWLTRGSMEPAIASLSDTQVLALCDSELSLQEQTQLSDLLGKQRENQLRSDERSHLDHLLQRYRRGLVRKAEAWKIAVERGLRPAIG